VKAYGFIELWLCRGVGLSLPRQVLCSLVAVCRHLSVIAVYRNRVLLPCYIVSCRRIWKVLDPQCPYFLIRKIFGNRENYLEPREHYYPV